MIEKVKSNPLTEMKVFSKFGWRKHPKSGHKDFHNGIDLSASLGTPCYAIARGKVLISTFHASLGYYVVIEHEGFLTVYSHLQKKGLDVGKVVDAKTIVGYVGNTGNSTGPHLHFEIREGSYNSNQYFWDRGDQKNGQYPNSVDPLIYINQIIKSDQSKYVSILMDKVNNPDAWLSFIEESKNHPCGKYLPELILKLSE